MTGLYTYQARFIAPLVAGTKQGTIRVPRKPPSRHVQAGEIMRAKAGQRFKQWHIGDATVARVYNVTLNFHQNYLLTHDGQTSRVRATYTAAATLDRFAVEDGFQDWLELRAYWLEQHEGRLVFRQHVRIEWERFEPTEEALIWLTEQRQPRLPLPA